MNIQFNWCSSGSLLSDAASPQEVEWQAGSTLSLRVFHSLKWQASISPPPFNPWPEHMQHRTHPGSCCGIMSDNLEKYVGRPSRTSAHKEIVLNATRAFSKVPEYQRCEAFTWQCKVVTRHLQFFVFFHESLSCVRRTGTRGWHVRTSSLWRLQGIHCAHTLPFKSSGSLRNVFIFQRKALFFQ